MLTVRDAACAEMLELGLDTIFANPGSTEISLLVDLPERLRFVLALHEAAVVGAATGYALARDRPALVLLHTTAGLGNAVGALATAAVNRAPLVVLVGQQDRRHLAQEPFLAGRLTGLAGDYPVAVHEPVRAQDIPGTLRQAAHEAMTWRGPVLITVPQDDWAAPAPQRHEIFGPRAVLRPGASDPESVLAVAQRCREADSVALVTGAGADDPRAWAALTRIAEALEAPVWQEAFAGRAGFPQDHRLFAGQLPAERGALRRMLAAHDLVLTVGCGAFRQYPYAGGPLLEPGTETVLVSADAREIHRSPVQLAVLADVATFVTALARELGPAPSSRAEAGMAAARMAPAQRPPDSGPLRAEHVLAALAEGLPADTVLFEEAPSNKTALHRHLQVRRPGGFLTPAMGGLGFSLPAAIGVRMACPERPVLAVLGDGSSLYAIQGLWTAARYEVGAVFVVLANGAYAIMDKLARRAGGQPVWPSLTGVSVATLADGFGVESRRVTDRAGLAEMFAEVLPGLADRRTPLLVQVDVEADTGTEL